MAIKVKETGSGIRRIVLAAAAAVVIFGGIWLGVVLSDRNGIGIEGSVTVDIPSGSGAAAVADILEQNGIIKHPMIFRLESRMGGYDTQYQPGTITVSGGMSYGDILDLLVTANRDTVRVVIPEGYEARQIAEALAEAGVAGAGEFMAALDPSLYEYAFLDGIPDREVKLEGYLFPATYEIPVTYSGREIVDLMLKTFDSMFKDEYYARAAEIGMTVDDVITMASIVERETNADSERAKVAGVFYNRINSGMKLQSCATVQYVLGERKPVLSIADTQIDSPYNTYVYPGLPIGPIANPGEECIKAALYPEVTDAYYFCLSSSGEHIFSKTYEEHVAAMESNDLVMNVDSSALSNEDSMK